MVVAALGYAPVVAAQGVTFQPLRPTGGSQAEQVTRGSTVMNRARPELDALGVPVGGFYLYPQVSAGEAFRDNIFDTQSNAQSDAITDIRPALRLQSNFGRHALAFYSDADIGRYLDHSREDYNDYTVGGQGRLDVVGRSHLDLGSSYKHLHEDRASPNNVNGLTPTEYDDTNVTFSGTAALARVNAQAGMSYDRLDYSNVTSQTGTVIDNSSRNRDEYDFTTQVGYEIAPLRTVFVRGVYNMRNYDQAVDFGGVDRTSHGYEVALGASYDLTGVTFAQAFVGYRAQNYDAASLSTVSGVSAGGRLIWNVTTLDTVTASLTRDIDETTVGGASSYFSTDGSIRLDHELLRNLILHAQALYGNDSFNGIGRNDHREQAGFGAIYQMSRYFSLSGDYTFRARQSNASGQDFTENVVALRLTARY